MLNHSQTLFLRLASLSQHNPNNPFFGLPIEIIRHIKHSPTPDPNFLAALKEVAYAQLEPLRLRLENAKNDKTQPAAIQNLLLQAGNVTTPAGLFIQDTTLLECAICAGDLEMVEVIKPYFLEFKDGEEEMIIQLKRCQSAIREMSSSIPYDLNDIMNIILTSNLKDVLEELKTGKAYDWSHSSPLRNALNQFRKNKLDPKNRHITTPKMHCNYQNLIHAYEMLNTYWEQLKTNGSYDKHDLFARLIIGFIQLTELTAFDRQLFAQGEIEVYLAGKTTSRSFKYRHSNALFPDYNKDFISTRSNIGFNSYISIYGAGLMWEMVAINSFTKLISNKNIKLTELYSHLERNKPHR